MWLLNIRIYSGRSTDVHLWHWTKTGGLIPFLLPYSEGVKSIQNTVSITYNDGTNTLECTDRIGWLFVSERPTGTSSLDDTTLVGTSPGVPSFHSTGDSWLSKLECWCSLNLVYFYCVEYRSMSIFITNISIFTSISLSIYLLHDFT